MILKPETRQLLVELSKTNQGKALKEFLYEAESEIGDIRSSKTWEETLGRQFALKMIDDLFALMKEEKPTTDKARNQYV